MSKNSVQNRPFAVFAPVIGGLSETFIQRHMREILPGGTVVVANTDGSGGGPYGGHWGTDCPTLLLSQVRSERTFTQRVLERWFRRPGGNESMPVVAVKAFLRDHGVRVVMGEYLDWSEPWLRVLHGEEIKFFGHAHGYDISVKLRDAEWQTRYLHYNLAAGIITMCEASKARLVAFGLDARKIHVVPYGVDVPGTPQSRPDRDAIRCLAVGRMVAKKGPILMLDAFRRALKANRHLRLDCVGRGELLPAARQFILTFDLGDRVTLHGGQPKEAVASLMRNADIFLQHSLIDPDTGDEEGLPVAVLEAMATGLPIIATRHAGIPEAVVDGVTGYLVDEGDSAGMAERLIALARDPELRRRMGEAGWRRARENFTWERERAELLEILNLARHPGDAIGLAVDPRPSIRRPDAVRYLR